jgi:hypothetical protein
MARRIPTGMTQSDYTGHGGSLLDYTPPDMNWMAPATPRAGADNPYIITDPSFRLTGSDPGGSILGAPQEGHKWAYPIYHWGNPIGTTESPRYMATNVMPDNTASNLGWTNINWPTYTTNASLYPQYSYMPDPFDLREDEEGNPLYQILLGQTQIPEDQISEGDWFNLQSFHL